MTSYKYLIIGGGIAGVTAAETIRTKDAEGSIGLISDEPYVLYSRVMLSKPNFFLGKVPFDQIYLKGKEWYETNHIDFLGGKKAVNLDTTKKIITLADGAELQYQKLLLATGVDARRSTIGGADKKNVHYLRTLEDGMKIMANLKTAKHAITVGGGFISFEMADLMRMAGMETTLLLRETYFWEPMLDKKSGDMIEAALVKGGVTVLKGAEAAAINGGDSVESVTLKDGRTLPCELIIFGIGTTGTTDWLKQAGIEVNRGIVANEFLETNAPDVWTAGDVAEYNDLILGEHVIMGNWVNGREQGRVAALNMAGDKRPFKFVSFYTTQGFGTTIAFVGDASPGADRVIIPRGSPEANSYARILIVGKEIIGATLINRTSEMTVISRLIDQNVDVSGKLAELGDPKFDLKSLLA
jgi:NAD(P)H-nitrite reductase large subunit